jgi:hypothetical protein
MEVDDYLFAYRKLREGGLSEVDSNAYHSNIQRAWAGMNRHQRELAICLTNYEHEFGNATSDELVRKQGGAV